MRKKTRASDMMAETIYRETEDMNIREVLDKIKTFNETNQGIYIICILYYCYYICFIFFIIFSLHYLSRFFFLIFDISSSLNSLIRLAIIGYQYEPRVGTCPTTRRVHRVDGKAFQIQKLTAVVDQKQVGLGELVAWGS